MALPIKPRLAVALAAVALAGLSAAPAALAAPHSQMAHGKKMAAHTVYVCKDCKAYYSAMQAKKMGYKDGMGHTLTKMSKAPAGFTDGSKMKM
jgi:hypothetical protein